MKNWYVVFCKPRQEDRAQLNLERQGYPTYLPKLLAPVRRQGRPVQAIQPLFPRYLFLHLDAQTDNWSPIRSTWGVAGLVHFGQRPAMVPDEIIEGLRERENAQGLHQLVTRELRSGDRVRVIDGPMRDLEGIFLCRSGKDRVLILLELLGKETRVQVQDWLVSSCG